MSKELDYSSDIMKQALHFLSRERIVDENSCKLFLNFIEQVDTQIKSNQAPAAMDTNLPEINATSTQLSINLDELEKLYEAELEDKRFDTAAMKLEEEEKYNHHYNSNILASGGGAGASGRMQRIVKECQMLATSLPISIYSSIFVRADEERMDVLKAVITGPKDTPYSLGCFLFDIYFPPSYPNDPPLCNLETTGNGTVRFNPNLYNCGKVCLSLLGTWHGDAASKWNSSSSTLHQVLVSIQALILVEHPYYNEPAYEAQRGTKEGDMRSKEYNEVLRLGTLRHAMIGQMRNPSSGFEDVIRTHFRLQKDRVLNQCIQWLNESSIENRSKFERSIEDLKVELSKL